MTAPTKADAAAADRLLKAAVRRTVAEIADGHRGERYDRNGTSSLTRWSWRASTEASDLARTRTAVVAMLTAAGESAALLLGEAS